MEPGNKNEYNVAQTYAEDMANVIENDKGGLVRKIIHGAEEHELENKNLSPQSKKNKLYMILGILFIAIALGTLFFFAFKKKSPTVSVQQQFTPLVFNDKTSYLEIKGLTSDQITQTIVNEVNGSTVKAGGVEGIYPTEDKNIIGLREFLRVIKSNFVPGDSTLVYDNFLLGVMNDNTKPASPAGGDFFILLKMRSTPDIFDSLRTWETKMFSDLHGFFGVSIDSTNNYLITKSFQDGIVGNKNARILYDNNNNIVMMYIFADDNSVVIAGTTSAAQEIMNRLASSQIAK